MELNNNLEMERIDDTVKYCPNCGKKISGDASYCLSCGFNIDGKKKKRKKSKKIAAIIILLIIGSISGGSAYFIQEKAKQEAYEAERQAELAKEEQRQEAIQSYEMKAYEIYNQMAKARFNLDSIGSKLVSSSELRDMTNRVIGVPVMSLSDYTNSCSMEVSEEKIRKEEIERLYGEWKNIECNEDEIQKVKSVLEEFYVSYLKRYDMLVEMNFNEMSIVEDEKENSSNFIAKMNAAQEIMYSLNLEDNTEL